MTACVSQAEILWNLTFPVTKLLVTPFSYQVYVALLDRINVHKTIALQIPCLILNLFQIWDTAGQERFQSLG